MVELLILVKVALGVIALTVFVQARFRKRP
jgi:hypothetical protein